MTTNLDPQLNDADVELLSTYIDRRLSDAERAALVMREHLQAARAHLRLVLDDIAREAADAGDGASARPR